MDGEAAPQKLTWYRGYRVERSRSKFRTRMVSAVLLIMFVWREWKVTRNRLMACVSVCQEEHRSSLKWRLLPAPVAAAHLFCGSIWQAQTAWQLVTHLRMHFFAPASAHRASAARAACSIGRVARAHQTICAFRLTARLRGCAAAQHFAAKWIGSAPHQRNAHACRSTRCSAGCLTLSRRRAPRVPRSARTRVVCCTASLLHVYAHILFAAVAAALTSDAIRPACALAYAVCMAGSFFKNAALAVCWAQVCTAPAVRH